MIRKIPERVMKAVGYYRSLPIDQDEALLDLDVEKPTPAGRDLLVKVEAVSVNPVDTKVRRRASGEKGAPKILGFDAAGTIRIGKPARAGAILIIGGAGGVGSIAIQLARRLTGLTIVTTASRPETRQWCLDLGAHHVVDHRQKLVDQVTALGMTSVEYIFSITNTDQHFAQIVELVAPQGKFGLIDDPPTLDALPFKRKAVSIHWESMFTRSMFKTPDMIGQHNLLSEVARLVDDGLIRTTLGETMGKIDAAMLRKAHALVESGRAKGKVVLEGF
jgi:NADPH2:quinone reductase